MSATAAAADVVYVGFVTGHGGDALQMLTLASGVQAAGLRVRVVVPANTETVAFARRCDDLGVACERTPLITAEMGGSRQSLRRVFALLRANPAPVVHFHTGNSCLPRSLLPCLEVLRNGRRVATLQSPVETIQPGTLRARTWALLANRNLDAVISPSEHGTRFQLRCGVEAPKAVTIRNAIEVERFAAGDGAGPRRLLGIGDEVPLVLFCSRLDSQKRPIEALEAFARVAEDFPRAQLVFAGSGAEGPRVEARAGDLGLARRVHLVGYQTNVADWLAAAAVWLLPTERENFSVALLEALAAGCPVLTTSCPGNDEVLVEGENALTFGVGDVDAAAAGLRRLLGDAALRGRLGAAGRHTASQHSACAMVENVRALYDRLVPGLPR